MAAREPSRIAVDVSALAPDATTIDALARLGLAARRRGLEVRLRDPTPQLRELLAFVGLEGVLGVEPGREAEEAEQPLGLEEERELADPTA
jgi:anti-anti-sigma regulatory factor